MPLGREVDDVAGTGELTGLEDEHAPRLYGIALAPGNIGLEVLGKGAFELKRDAAPHDPDAVDGVDQSFGFFLEDVTSLVLDHGLLLLRQ